MSGKSKRDFEAWVHESNVNAVGIHDYGRYIVSGCDDSNVYVSWRVGNGYRSQILKGHTAPVASVSSSGDRHIYQKLIASGSWDNTVRVWNINKWGSKFECLHVLRGHSREVWSVSFSDNGKLIASGSADRMVRVWSAVSGVCLHELKGHRLYVNSVSFSGDDTIVSGSADKTVRVWNTSGECLHELEGHDGEVMSVSCYKNLIVSGSNDRTVRVWNTSGELMRTLTGHTSGVNSVSFFGDIIVSGSNDMTVRVWDASGELLQTLTGHTSVVTSVSCYKNLIVSGSLDNTVHVWNTIDVLPERLLHADVKSEFFKKDLTERYRTYTRSYTRSYKSIKKIVEAWQTRETESFFEEDGEVFHDHLGETINGMPLFQYLLQTKRINKIYETEKHIAIIPGGFDRDKASIKISDTEAKLLNGINPVQHRIAGRRALISLMHVLVIPKLEYMRIFNAVSLPGLNYDFDDAQYCGRQALTILKEGDNNKTGSLQFWLEQTDNLRVQPDDLSVGCRVPTSAAEHEMNIRYSFHAYGNHSIGYLHMHVYDSNLLTKAYDETNGFKKNTPVDIVKEWVIETQIKWVYTRQLRYSITVVNKLSRGKVVCGNLAGYIHTWNIQSDTWDSWEAHDGSVTSVTRLPNNRIATGSEDSSLKIWNGSSLELELKPIEQKFIVYSITYAGDKLFFGSQDKLLEGFWVNVCELKTGKLIKEKHFYGQMGKYGLAIIKNKVFVGLLEGKTSDGKQKTIEVWDLENDNMGTIAGHTAGVTCLATLGGKLVSASIDKTIRIWHGSGNTWTCEKILRGHSYPINCMSVDKNKIVSGSDYGTVKIWTPDTGQVQSFADVDVKAVCQLGGKIAVVSNSRGKIWEYRDPAMPVVTTRDKNFQRGTRMFTLITNKRFDRTRDFVFFAKHLSLNIRATTHATTSQSSVFLHVFDTIDNLRLLTASKWRNELYLPHNLGYLEVERRLEEYCKKNNYDGWYLKCRTDNMIDRENRVYYNFEEAEFEIAVLKSSLVKLKSKYVKRVTLKDLKDKDHVRVSKKGISFVKRKEKLEEMFENLRF